VGIEEQHVTLEVGAEEADVLVAGDGEFVAAAARPPPQLADRARSTQDPPNQLLLQENIGGNQWRLLGFQEEEGEGVGEMEREK
jgi:hypothetical protein